MARTRLLEQATELAARLALGTAPSQPDDEIVALIGLVGILRRSADSIGAQLAAELDRRSAVPETSLARALGERSAAVAVARLASIDPREAHDWIAAGRAAATPSTITGEPLPPQHEHVAANLRSAAITPRAARAIVDALDAIGDRCSRDESADLERLLLDYAPQLTSREFDRLCGQAVDRFDPDGAEPREDDLRSRSGLTITRGRDGLTTFVLKAHPEAAGFLLAAVDARTAPRRIPTFEDRPIELNPAAHDDRTLAQKRLDAFVEIARESIAHDNGRLAGTTVTLSVTMTLDALLTGVGVAQVAGVDAPISARTARRLAADAEIIPIVLGGAGEPLDVGRSSRLFTEPQRRALALRDGGCIWPGCDAPPGWCEVAHLVPWSHGGPTDLDNGALMCAFHHRRFDNDGWALERGGGATWLIPPAWVDSARTPRRAGRLPRAA